MSAGHVAGIRRATDQDQGGRGEATGRDGPGGPSLRVSVMERAVV